MGRSINAGGMEVLNICLRENMKMTTKFSESMVLDLKRKHFLRFPPISVHLLKRTVHDHTIFKNV